jgi:hypothetical protein
MDPILSQVYATILAGAPYVLVAYVLLWLVALVYILIIAHGARTTAKRLDALEQAMASDSADHTGISAKIEG